MKELAKFIGDLMPLETVRIKNYFDLAGDGQPRGLLFDAYKKLAKESNKVVPKPKSASGKKITLYNFDEKVIEGLQSITTIDKENEEKWIAAKKDIENFIRKKPVTSVEQFIDQFPILINHAKKFVSNRNYSNS